MDEEKYVEMNAIINTTYDITDYSNLTNLLAIASKNNLTQ